MTDGCWLPELELFEHYDYDWASYENAIYDVFKNDFILSQPVFNHMIVDIKRYPYEFGKEDAFFHITCKDYKGDGERDPDFRRCERIRWIRAFIENYNCNPNDCIPCSGIKVWCEQSKRGKQRIHFLFEDERYLVVLENRKTYYLLITAFYLDYDNSLEKKLKHYDLYHT